MKKTVQPLMQSRVEFLCEQDGSPEKDLKARLAQLFDDDDAVQRAYLARIGYGNPNENNVGLCIRADKPDAGLAEKIGYIFARMFNREQHLDILFLNDEQELRLSDVCKPFFLRDHE